ncbi:zinc-dependent peptidase [Roseateles sp. BYS180W]|uniref:Zinc-dependent peptidase n=1 Tax=Roseateles rivi TaxID=3299028 RepID=A0ABW7FVA1_9BURK
MTGLWARWQVWREARLLRQHAIPEALWQATLARYPFLNWRSPEDVQRLRQLATLFLTRKEFHAVPPLQLSDEMAVAIAAQACVPILHLGLRRYEGFVGIVLHPQAVHAAREHHDDIGLVHQYDEELAGEAMEGGPLTLAWSEVQATDSASAYNVVIHEFAHVLDMNNGSSDGVPTLPSAAARAAWQNTLMTEWDWLCGEAVVGRPTVVDPYGAHSPVEFFAVASEAFFVAPGALKAQRPALYALLGSYFAQDPAAWAPPQG